MRVLPKVEADERDSFQTAPGRRNGLGRRYGRPGGDRGTGRAGAISDVAQKFSGSPATLAFHQGRRGVA